MSRLDRVTLQLGVAVAVIIAVCSYAVSATSLYALGVQAGYSWWQAAAVPVVADGPAIYGMFRIVSRSRRGAKGAGYGWLLVGCGTLASIGGNVAHAQPDLVAQAIAAAIPLAVLAMLEGLKGDAGEVAHLAAQAAGRDRAGTLEPAGQLPQATTVRRTDPTATLDTRPRRRLPAAALPAGSRLADRHYGRGRLQAAYAQPRPDGQPWTARTLAEAAGCGRSSAASFLQRQRSPPWSTPNEPAQRLLRDAALGYASRGIPVLPLHYPLPHRGTSSPLAATDSCRTLRWRRVARVGIQAAASPVSTPSAAWSPTGSRTPPPIGPGSWPGGPAPPGQHRPGHRPSLRRPGRRRPRRRPGHPRTRHRPWPAELRAAGPHRRGWLALLRG